MKKVFKVIVAVILFLLVCAFVVLANCFASSKSASAEYNVEYVVNTDYNYKVGGYMVNKPLTDIINEYFIDVAVASATITKDYPLVDKDGKLLSFYYQNKDYENKFFIVIRVQKYVWSTTSISYNMNVYFYKNYINNAFDTQLAYYSFSNHVTLNTTMLSNMPNVSISTFVDPCKDILKNGFWGFHIDGNAYSESDIIDMYSTQYKYTWYMLNNFFCPSDITIPFVEDTPEYRKGYLEGKTYGTQQVIKNPNNYGLYTSTQYQEYGQSEFNDGYTTGSDDTGNYTTSWFLGIFKGLAQFFAIPIFGQITFGTLVLIPFAISLAWFIIRTFRGGGGS